MKHKPAIHCPTAITDIETIAEELTEAQRGLMDLISNAMPFGIPSDDPILNPYESGGLIIGALEWA